MVLLHVVMGGTQYCYCIMYCHWRHAVLLLASKITQLTDTQNLPMCSKSWTHEWCAYECNITCVNIQCTYTHILNSRYLQLLPLDRQL